MVLKMTLTKVPHFPQSRVLYHQKHWCIFIISLSYFSSLWRWPYQEHLWLDVPTPTTMYTKYPCMMPWWMLHVLLCQVTPILSQMYAVRFLRGVPAVGPALLWLCKKLYAQFVLSYALVSFALYSYDRYLQVLKLPCSDSRVYTLTAVYIADTYLSSSVKKILLSKHIAKMEWCHACYIIHFLCYFILY